MHEHPYGWLSLAPPVIAILMAIATRRVLTSLLAGLAVGSLILAGGNPVVATTDLFETQLWQTTVQPDKLRVVAFSVFLSAMIGVIQVSGGMRGLVDLLTPWARGRRSGQLVTWLLGMIVFFDDYANCLLVGGTMQPTCDRLRISREKLAFLVDATAAPVAGLAIISTWIAIELDYIREGIANLDAGLAAELNPFELFLACIPYRFYVIQMLLFVPLVAIARRDFGPMLSAERRAAAGLPPERAAGPISADSYENAQAAHASHWSNAVVPIVVTLAVSLWLIHATGAAQIGATAADDTRFERFRAAFGAGNSIVALYYGGLAGLLTAMALARWRVGIAATRIAGAAGFGARMVLPPLAILILAGAMSRMTGNKSPSDAPTKTPYEYQDTRLYTGDYMKQLLLSASDGATERFAQWLPTTAFVLACVISFCTGTSYGTMGILVPIVIPLAVASLGAIQTEHLAENPLFLASMGSILAGAIFGDHCSPISDTTVLSSLASGCDHMAHVTTQLPYAVLVAVAATLGGTVLLGFGVSVWWLLPLQTAALVGALFVLGKRVDG